MSDSDAVALDVGAIPRPATWRPPQGGDDLFAAHLDVPVPDALLQGFKWKPASGLGPSLSAAKLPLSRSTPIHLGAVVTSQQATTGLIRPIVVKNPLQRRFEAPRTQEKDIDNSAPFSESLPDDTRLAPHVPSPMSHASPTVPTALARRDANSSSGCKMLPPAGKPQAAPRPLMRPAEQPSPSIGPSGLTGTTSTRSLRRPSTPVPESCSVPHTENIDRQSLDPPPNKRRKVTAAPASSTTGIFDVNEAEHLFADGNDALAKWCRGLQSMGSKALNELKMAVSAILWTPMSPLRLLSDQAEC
jgi:hypothetical protein